MFRKKKIFLRKERKNFLCLRWNLEENMRSLFKKKSRKVQRSWGGITCIIITLRKVQRKRRGLGKWRKMFLLGWNRVESLVQKKVIPGKKSQPSTSRTKENPKQKRKFSKEKTDISSAKYSNNKKIYSNTTLKMTSLITQTNTRRG